jgi:GNAT superfamily N-acetyltransferase
VEIVIREFAEADRRSLRTLFVASRNAAFAWVPAGTHKDEDFDVATKGELILVAVHHRDIVGFVSIWGPDNFLHLLFVHPLFWRRGVGKTLLMSCDKYCSGTPTLKCLKANDSARQFYLSQGWSVRHEADGPDGRYLLMARESRQAMTWKS